MDRGFLLESLRSALEAIKTNKLRSLLTTLGIIIGVTTVISVISVITGLKQKIATSFSSLGANVLYIQKYPWVMGGAGVDWWKIRQRKNLGMEEYKALKEYGSSFTYVAPQISNRFDVKHGDKKVDGVSVDGTTEDFPEIMNQQVKLGRFLSTDDIQYRRDVCVLGNDVATTLFPDENPVGKTVRINGRVFTVIGLLEELGELMGQSMDNVAVIPYTTMTKFTGRRRSLTITVLAEDEDEAREEIRWILRRVRRVKEDEEDDFSINSAGALTRQFNQLTRALFIIMVGIAGISLVVGGIGIMNIMLVSVTERTREIGVRKAIGAKSSEILGQFLLESIMICFVGGFIGILLGFSLTKLISLTGNIPFGMPIWAILLGFGFSFIIGVFFGFYPARKAAALNPVEALRYE
ncbi:MAG: FtsX-like permease family protein [Candidatus Stahlbacteria bacterium]|nr:MAG: FtsX-like permease family protein [Candidatus Stahlbacteria bacterium]